MNAITPALSPQLSPTVRAENMVKSMDPEGTLEPLPPHDDAACSSKFDKWLGDLLRDRNVLGKSFAEFAEAFVPRLATLGLNRPDLVSAEFDLHLDNGLFRATGEGIPPDDLAQLEAYMNADPRIRRLARTFNDNVVAMYGDIHRSQYMTFIGNFEFSKPVIPDLARTVDRDVGFMALLRKVRDVDLRGHPWVDESNRYEAANTEVLDFIVKPDTYDVAADGTLALKQAKAPPMATWVA